MDNEQRMAEMRRCLLVAFAPEHLEIIDESAAHKGHPGAKSGAGHFAVILRAACFNDMPMLQSHRLIYDALKALMGCDIHALRIDVKGL